MFIRITAVKWKLDDDARMMLGALLVYMRNEFRAGVSAAEHHPPDVQSEAVWGAAANYKKMMQCIDRMLARLDGTWDAHKLTLAMDIVCRAIGNAKDGRLARAITNEAENHYGVMALDSSWNREQGEGHDRLPSASGDEPRQ